MDGDKVSFMGVCRVGERARRVDVKVYPRSALPTALLYFTGSGKGRGMMESSTTNTTRMYV